MKRNPLFYRADPRTPAGLAGGALLLALPLILAHLLGWREHTAFLSLSPVGDASLPASALRGGMYLGSWFIAVLGSPVLLLAAGLLALWNRISPP